MADKREPIPVDFGDGIPRQLKLNITATRKLKERYSSIEKMMEGEVMEILPDCLFAALVDKDGLTPEKVADIIDIADIQPLWHTFLHAMTHVDVAAKLKAAEEKAALEVAEPKPETEAESEDPNEQTQPAA